MHLKFIVIAHRHFLNAIEIEKRITQKQLAMPQIIKQYIIEFSFLTFVRLSKYFSSNKKI